MAGELIARMISEAKNNIPTNSCGLLFGQVTKINPLEIYIDSKYALTQDMLILMSPVKEKKVSFYVDGIKHEIEIFRNLRVGDKVCMIKSQGNEFFYVLDRR